LHAQATKAIERCHELAHFSESPNGTTRTFLSPAMHDCHRAIAKWLEPLGANVSVVIDAAGNFRAVYRGTELNAPRLLIGSHLDTVPNAGAFDGPLGVVLGAAFLEHAHKERLPFDLEIVGFSEEEGVRFSAPFIGSRALVCALDDDLLRRKDERGITVRQAIDNFGLNPADIPKARLQGEILGYVEFHIEQGPVLESLGLPLAAVDAIASQARIELLFTGRPNHAGTTPMHLRYDSVAGAAEWIAAVERQGKSVEGLVATVGIVEPKPGVANVIAGETRVTLDVRHRRDEIRAREASGAIRAAEEIASRRGLSLTHRVLLDQRAVPMDATLVSQIDEALRKSGCKPHHMVSGAGHDAMILAEKVPAAMIFLRTPGGISHSPAESVLVEDVEKAIEAGSYLLELLATSPVHKGA
jgi:allantoate deiminase